MTDRFLGYSILVLLFCVLCATLAYSAYVLLHPAQKIVVSFAQVGNLSVDDPVTVNGVTAGKIVTITGRGSRVYVTLAMTPPLSVYPEYRFSSIDRGLMGDRLITLDRGDTTRRAINTADTMQGHFFIGISEVLGMALILETTAVRLRSGLDTLLTATPNRQSLIVQFNDIVHQADSLTKTLRQTLNTVSHKGARTVASINTATRDARRLVERLASQTPHSLTMLDSTFITINDLISQADSVATLLSQTVTLLNDPDGIIREDATERLTQTLADTKSLINELQVESAKLKLIIHRWKE